MIKIKKHILPILMVLGVVLSLNQQRFVAPRFFVESASVLTEQAALYEKYDTSANLSKAVHSATAVKLGNGNLLAMWYGGTREGHRDVKIYSAIFDQKIRQWQTPNVVLDRYQASDDLGRYIKKIGNPVLVRHPQGPLVLVYVSVSLAGWATSQLNMMVSYDDGQSWHQSKHLVTTPFLNISTLVKNDAVIYEDGTIGIAAYHELMGEFSEIIRVTLDGKVVNKYRISSGDLTIQPSISSFNSTDAVAYLRDSGRKVQKVRRSVTQDGGQTWSPYESLALDNPNSAVFSFIDNKSRNWLVFNDATRDQPHSRNNLALAVSDDRGVNWRTVHYFEQTEVDEQEESKYSYPWVTLGDNGQYHLFYTWNRQVIKHVLFNQAWLEEKT